MSLSQICTFTKKITKIAVIGFPQADKLTGEGNSRTTCITGYFWKRLIIVSDVRLGGYASTVCAAVACISDQEEYRQEGC